MTRKFEAKPAVREAVPLLIGLCGPSGSGKTYSALRLAAGIQSVAGGDVYGIDTESGRMLHYADQFKFFHIPMEPPFGSLDYLEAFKFAASKNASVVVVDSMTHEHIGEGGYLEVAEKTVEQIAKGDEGKRERSKFAGWAKVGPPRQRMIEGMKRYRGNVICCFRAKEKVKPVKQGGRLVPVELGMMPIGSEEWVYEMTVNCLLHAKSDGVPTWRTDHVGERMMIKLPERFRSIFPEGAPLSEDIGRQLAEWARGGAVTAKEPEQPPAQPDDESSRLLGFDAMLGMAADQGSIELKKCWELNIPRQYKATMEAALRNRHKPRAEEVDRHKLEDQADAATEKRQSPGGSEDLSQLWPPGEWSDPA